MTSNPFKCLFALCLGTVVTSGCVLNQLGEPPPGETDLWTKPGHTRSHIFTTIMKCRQESTGKTSREKSESESLCMLRAGFKFVNWRAPHTFCKAGEKDPWAWNTPACRSLRGEIIITLDESASVPPSVKQETTEVQPLKVTIPNAPSTAPAQRLQDKIQKDSNNQMNQLLQSGGRK